VILNQTPNRNRITVPSQGGQSDAHLSEWVRLHLPAPREVQLQVREADDEGDQVPVVLVALKVAGVAADLQDHVLEARAVGEHAVRALRVWDGSVRFAFLSYDDVSREINSLIQRRACSPLEQT